MANRSGNVGAFVPTTNEWDPSQILSVEVDSPEFKQLLVRLYQNLSNMAHVVNVKDSGFYNTNEFVTGQQFFPNPSLSSSTQNNPNQRPVFRKVINFGALPNTGAKSVAHGITITSTVSFTRIYATATNPSTSFIPIPYASPTDANEIELSVDATNVTITTGSNRSAYTTTYVILEWIIS